jgi:flagellar motility protein MotE (MotC chaperone)
MIKISPMKNHLTQTEKLAVETLTKIKYEGLFNQLVVNTMKEKKVDKIRMIFQMIKDQNSTGRMEEVIGREALQMVLLT